MKNNYLFLGLQLSIWYDEKLIFMRGKRDRYKIIKEMRKEIKERLQLLVLKELLVSDKVPTKNYEGLISRLTSFSI